MKKILSFVAMSLLMGIAWGKPQITPSRQDAIWDEVDTQVVMYADAHFHAGDFPRAIRGLRFRYAMHPDDWDVVTDLGWMLESTDREDEALAMYMKYHSSYPDRRDAAYSEVEFWFKKKAYAKVPPLVEPELAKRPHPNMYRWLAHSYEKLNRFSDSIRIWDLLLELTPNDEAAKNNRRRVEGKLKDQPI